MPREAEELLPRFVRELVNQRGFSFGSPWLSDGSPTAMLPILRTDVRTRRYRLAEELADRVRAEDVGQIDRLRIHNDAEMRILVRPGTLFASEQTQSRGTTAGAILEPRSASDIESRCVHASQSILAGSQLELSPHLAPVPVYRALLSRDQGSVWTSIVQSVGVPPHGQGDAGGPDARARSSDDLMGALSDSGQGADATDTELRDVPAHPSECGVLVLDGQGVLAAEIFDNPDSWRAASSGILRRFSETVRPRREAPWRSEVEREPAIRLALEFLEELGKARGRRVTGHGWMVRSPLAAYTVLDGDVVHLVAFRPEGPGDPRPAISMASEQAGVPIAAEPDPIIDVPVWAPMRTETAEAGDTAVAVGAVAAELDEERPPPIPPTRARRRKVLTSGWDGPTYRALEHFSHKEFQGDRSAAMRFLVRHGLRRRGYMGPQPVPESASSLPISEAEPTPSSMEAGREFLAVRIHDLERIAHTAGYATWLRQRAHAELERIATGEEDEPVRSAAQSALDRIPPTAPAAPEPEPEPSEPDVPPAAPPVDVRGLLKAALEASVGSNYAKALARFDEVLDADPFNMTALLGRAVAFKRAGKTQEALAALDLVLRLEPRNAAALLNRARVLRGRGDLRGALEAMDRLVEAAPNDWDVWMERGDLLARIGRDDEAFASYAEALRRNPDNEELQRRTRTLDRPRPSAPRTTSSAWPEGIEEGQSYLAKERNTEASHRMFRAVIAQNVPALLVTKTAPDKIRQETGLAGVHVAWLSRTHAPEAHDPAALAPLSLAIGQFVEGNRGRGVILLEDLDTLIAENGFRATILFVEHVNELIVQRRAIFLVSANPARLPEKEMAILERSLRILS